MAGVSGWRWLIAIAKDSKLADGLVSKKGSKL